MPAYTDLGGCCTDCGCFYVFCECCTNDVPSGLVSAYLTVTPNSPVIDVNDTTIWDSAVVIVNTAQAPCDWFGAISNDGGGRFINLICVDGTWYVLFVDNNPLYIGSCARFYMKLDSDIDCCSLTPQSITVTVPDSGPGAPYPEPCGPSYAFTSFPSGVTITSRCGCLTCFDFLDSLPDPLFCTISSDCPAADGKVITMNKDATDPANPFWYGEETIDCADCDLVYARLECITGVMTPSVGYKSSDEDGHPCGFSPPDVGCNPFASIDSTSPLEINGRSCYGGVGAGPCCDPGTLDWVITE